MQNLACITTVLLVITMLYTTVYIITDPEIH